MRFMNSLIFVLGGIAGICDGTQGWVIPGICIAAGIGILAADRHKEDEFPLSEGELPFLWGL